MKPKVVVTHKIFDETMKVLEPYCTLVLNESEETLPRDQLLDLCRDADAMMAFMPDWVDDTFLSACPKLKVIGAALKGYDNFDVDACSQHGVWLSIVPDYLTAPTAELTIALLLGLARNIGPADAFVRSGHFNGWKPKFYGSGLSGETIGLIGMGRVGQAIAQRLHGFESDIIYFDAKRLDRETEERLGLTYCDLERVAEQSKFLVPMLPYHSDTKHLINRSIIEKMPRGSYLINASRGSVVDEGDVADALSRGQLAGYAADVFEFEEWAREDRPLSIEPRLLEMKERTLFTPHLGSAVTEARKLIEYVAAQNILDALQGERPAHAINALSSEVPA